MKLMNIGLRQPPFISHGGILRPSEQLPVGHPDGGVRLHHLPLTVFTVKDSGPATRNLSTIVQNPYRTGRGPTNASLDEHLQPAKGRDPEAGVLRLPHQDPGHLLSYEPLIGIGTDQKNLVLTRGMALYRGGVLARVILEGGDDNIVQLG